MIDCATTPPGQRRGDNQPPDSIHTPDFEGPVIKPKADNAAPGGARDSIGKPDGEGPICAGSQRDPFPSTTVYIVATFVDPSVKHYDPSKKGYVVGPVTSKLYYQFAGIRKLTTRN